MILRPCEPADWPAVWAVLEPVFRAGETFPHDPAIDSASARRAWVETVDATVVATGLDGAILGTYDLRPNQPCLGAHVAHAGYVVAGPPGAGGGATPSAATPRRKPGCGGSRPCCSTWW